MKVYVNGHKISQSVSVDERKTGPKNPHLTVNWGGLGCDVCVGWVPFFF